MLSRVESSQAFANLLLHHQLSRVPLAPADAALVTELVNGTLRHRSRVDWTVAGALRHPLVELPPRIRAILRTATYQLLFLTRVPARAVVHEAVTLARRHGHAGTAALVNAVLRRISERGERPLPDLEPAARIALEHSHPRWLVDRWLGRLGADETLALVAANNAPAPISVRVNPLKTSPEDALQAMVAAGISAQTTVLPEGLILRGAFELRRRFVESGLLTPQDLGAMLVTHLLDPQPGETIIDACAAPGGKTTHIAERMGNQGRVIACDIHPGKLETVRRRAGVLSLRILDVHEQDARSLGRVWFQQADRVLVDAPCTGLGVLRRRPEIKWRVQPEHVTAMAALQGSILDGAADAVRPGGVLLYSVCTTEPEEGEIVVQEFLGRHAQFALDAGMPIPAGLTRAGDDVPGQLTLLPHRHDTDGFFIARMRRA